MVNNYGHIKPSHCKTCKELAEDCECKRDRLLSEKEICKLCGSECEGIIAENCDWRDDTYGECHKLLAAQLAKTDKEWVEWVSENIIEFVLNFSMDERNKDNLLHMWAVRKKEIGL